MMTLPWCLPPRFGIFCYLITYMRFFLGYQKNLPKKLRTNFHTVAFLRNFLKRLLAKIITKKVLRHNRTRRLYTASTGKTFKNELDIFIQHWPLRFNKRKRIRKRHLSEQNFWKSGNLPFLKINTNLFIILYLKYRHSFN